MIGGKNQVSVIDRKKYVGEGRLKKVFVRVNKIKKRKEQLACFELYVIKEQ